MKTMSPIEAHEQISRFATHQRIPEKRIVAAIANGEWVRQGDVYLQRIKAVSKDWKASGNRQLAPGTSQGSRHIVEGKLKLFVSPEARPMHRTEKAVRLLGPQIEADETFTVTHPEHAHIQLPPGCYQVSYQLDWSQQAAVRD